MPKSAHKKGTAAPRRAQPKEESTPAQKAEATARIIHWRETVEWSSLAPAQRSHADGLAQVMSFLPLDELVVAAQACRSWRTAALQAPPLEARVDYVNNHDGCQSADEVSPRLLAITASPFRKHIRMMSGGCMWSVAELKLLAELPRVGCIANMVLGVLKKGQRVPSDIPFPPGLQVMSMMPSSGARGSSMWRGVLQSLAARCPELKMIQIIGEPVPSMQSVLEPKVNFSAIESLQQVEEIVLEGILGIHFNEATFAHIKQLSNLRSLRLTFPRWGRDGSMDPREEEPIEPYLLEMFSPPHKMGNIRTLPLSRVTATQELTELLSATSLTEFTPMSIQLAALPELSKFSHLKMLIIQDLGDDFNVDDDLAERIFGPGEMNGVRGSFLVEVLKPCAHSLLVLEFPFISFGLKESEELCATFSELMELRLGRASWPSLVPLRKLKKLIVFRLQLRQGSSFSLTLEDVCALPRLKELSICGLPDSVDDAVISAIQKPTENKLNLEQSCVHKHLH